MSKVEFVIPSVLNKGEGEKKISIESNNLQDAFTMASNQMGEDFKRKVLDLNGKRALSDQYLH